MLLWKNLIPHVVLVSKPIKVQIITAKLQTTGILVTATVQRTNHYTIIAQSLPGKVKGKVAQSCLTLQARTLEWAAFPFSRGSSQPRDRTQVSCTAGRFFTSWATGKPSHCQRWCQMTTMWFHQENPNPEVVLTSLCGTCDLMLIYAIEK